MFNTSFCFSRFLTMFAVLIVLSQIGHAIEAKAEKRVALVIGNSSYENTAPLKTPRKDAEAVAEKLNKLGFEVVRGFDLDFTSMRRKVAQFSKKLRGADVSLLFYAGHGLQVDEKNYLAPIDTDIRDKGDLDFSTIPVRLIQRQMERETKTVLLFFDASRNNPLARNLRVAGRSIASNGLTSREPNARGTLIAFATDPDSVALDGEEKNSPFTTAFLKHIDNPSLEVNSMLTKVRVDVQKTTKGEQTPWVNSSLLGLFYFNEQTPGSLRVASLETANDKLKDSNSSDSSAQPRKTEDGSQILSMRMQQLAWEAVKLSGDPDELRYFIEQNGDGFFVGMAMMKLKKLENNQAKRNEEQRIANLLPLRDDYRPRELTKLVQEELNRVGCDAGRPDGSWGRNADNALNRFSKYAPVQLASTRPSIELLEQLRTQNAGVCPVSCTAKQELIDGQCIQNTCPAGQALSRNGNCYVPNRSASSRGSGLFLRGNGTNPPPSPPSGFTGGGRRLVKHQKQNLGHKVGVEVIGIGVCKALGKC